jgi:hypothetical protein
MHQAIALQFALSNHEHPMRLLTIILVALSHVHHNAQSAEITSEMPTKELKVLLIGNSYTARHNLAQVVKAMAEEGQPGLSFQPTSVIYGGRRMLDHWRLGSQNIVNSHSVTGDEIESTIKGLQDTLRKTPEDKHAKNAISLQKRFLKDLNSKRDQWDVVVLQSYRDDLEGDQSLYARYAPKFAALAKAQGAKVVLYETTPTTQNDKPLQTKPDSQSVMNKVRAIARLANQVDAAVAPMSLVGLKCQTQRPDLTLRFINDAHLNQTMAYLTACTLYAAIFDKDPRGLSVDSVTDIRFWQNKDRTKDRDNKPIKKVFSDQDRADLQRFAWEGYQEFNQLRVR